MKRFTAAFVAIVVLTLVDVACKGETVTLPGRVDTLIVHGPRSVDTIVVVRPDTIVVAKPETSFVQLPGRVDTVVVTRSDTTIIVRPETLIVVQHDTVIVHDTITHYDTVRLSRAIAHLCLQLEKADTIFFLSAVDTMCNSAHMSQYYPGYNVYADIIPNAGMLYRGTLLLPGYMRNHR
jgi:hypothetical protein